MVTPPRGESRDTGLRLDRPDGPPVAPAIDTGTLENRADQAARAAVAAAQEDVETILGRQFRFAHLTRIDADTAVRREEGAWFVDEAEFGGDRLVRAIDDGMSAELGGSAFAGRTSEQLRHELGAVRHEHDREAAELAVHETMLAGETTDETGADLRATVPRTTAARHRGAHLRDVLIFAPFEIVFAYFVYRLTVGSTPGANQVLMETIETISVVALALLVQLLLPPLVAHAIALLRRHDPASDTRQGRWGRWLRLLLPVVGGLLLVGLAASLRGAYLESLQSDEAALPIPGAWFALFAIVLLLMPMVVVVLVILRKNYWNPHIHEVLVRRPVVAELRARADALTAELERRERLIAAQEQITRRTMGAWADEVLHGIPAKASSAKSVYLETYVREARDPAITDAVSVATADLAADLGMTAAEQDARLTEELTARLAAAGAAADERARVRDERLTAALATPADGHDRGLP